MDALGPWMEQAAGVFVLVLARVGAFVATAPAPQATAVPLQARALIAVMLALVLVGPQLPAAASLQNDLVGLAALLVRETLLGVLLGIVVRIVLSAAEVAGQVASHMSGMGLAEAADPTFGVNESVLAQGLRYLAAAVYITIGGHRELVAALLDSYSWAPLTAAGDLAAFSDGAVAVCVATLAQSFVTGLRIAAPAIAAVLAALTVAGLIGRTLPQLNVLSFAFSFSGAVAVATIAFAAPTLGRLIDLQTTAAVSRLMETVAATFGGAAN